MSTALFVIPVSEVRYIVLRGTVLVTVYVDLETFVWQIGKVMQRRNGVYRYGSLKGT